MQATKPLTAIPMVPVPSVQRPTQPAALPTHKGGPEETILRIKKKAEETLAKTAPSAKAARNGLHQIAWECDQAEKQFDQSQTPKADIQISTGQECFSLHSGVLKFHSAILAEACKCAQASPLSPQVTRTVIPFFYTGTLFLTSDNFMEVLDAAKTWQMRSVESECRNLLLATANEKLFWTFWKKSFENEKYGQIRSLLLEWAAACTLSVFTCERAFSASFEAVKELLSKAPQYCTAEEKRNFVYAYHAKQKLEQGRLEELLQICNNSSIKNPVNN